MRKSTHKLQVLRPREKVYLLSLSKSDVIALRDACVCVYNLSHTPFDKELYATLLQNLYSQIN